MRGLGRSRAWAREGKRSTFSSLLNASSVVRDISLGQEGKYKARGLGICIDVLQGEFVWGGGGLNSEHVLQKRGTKKGLIQTSTQIFSMYPFFFSFHVCIFFSKPSNNGGWHCSYISKYFEVPLRISLFIF